MKMTKTFLLLFLAVLTPTNTAAMLREVREVHYQMGTYLEMTLWHEEPETARRLIRGAVQEVHRLNEILSHYDPDSALSRLNRHAGKGRVSIPVELHELLESARRFSAKTAGDFDVTIGPLMDFWRETASAGRLPDGEMLARVLLRVGYDKLKLYGSRQAALSVPDMKIDLGGIGKGYTVDRVAHLLKAGGVKSALINFGGSSIYAIGTPPGESGWKIGIKEPDDRLRGAIQLRDMALSASSGMGKFWIIGGKKYGHLVDPKSGMPVSEPRIATVITSSATAAEALTKPLVLLGQNALGTVERFDEAEAVVISDQSRLFFSSGFKSHARWQEIPNP